MQAPPPRPPSFVWLLIESLPRVGHRMVLGAFSTSEAAEAARAASAESLSLRRVAVDRPPERL